MSDEFKRFLANASSIVAESDARLKAAQEAEQERLRVERQAKDALHEHMLQSITTLRKTCAEIGAAVKEQGLEFRFDNLSSGPGRLGGLKIHMVRDKQPVAYYLVVDINKNGDQSIKWFTPGSSVAPQLPNVAGTTEEHCQRLMMVFMESVLTMLPARS